LQWHGPESGDELRLAVTAVADIILLQGTAPSGAPVTLNFDVNEAVIDAPHRFPHLANPTGKAVCFEHTLDSSVIGEARSVRANAGSKSTDLIALPELPAPGSMVGVETLERCPACASGVRTATGRRQHLTMETCAACGLVMTSPRPKEDHTLVRYNERYFEDEYLPSQTLTASLERHIDSILDHAEPAKDTSPRLFELGVGGGNLAARAVGRGWIVSGTDVNSASIAHAKSQKLDIWLENSDHATTLRGPYGAIISEMSLEHVRRPEHFCALAADALAPGGRLVIYTVSAEGASVEHSGMASPLFGPAEHLFLFSAGSLVSLCQRAGLRVETVWRNHTGDEIGIVASKRRDSGNPSIAPRLSN
jgi:SAM-dependent methyltransferase